MHFQVTEEVFENLLAIEMRNTKVLINKPIDLGYFILGISKIAIHDL